MGLLETTAEIFGYNFTADDIFDFRLNSDFDWPEAAAILFKSTDSSDFFFLHDLEHRLNKFLYFRQPYHADLFRHQFLSGKSSSFRLLAHMGRWGSG